MLAIIAHVLEAHLRYKREKLEKIQVAIDVNVNSEWLDEAPGGVRSRRGTCFGRKNRRLDTH